MKICTRDDQHNKNTLDGSIEESAMTTHSINCTGQIEWDNVKTIKVESKRFDRKVREALKIQHQECGPSKGGINLNDGQYVTTNFGHHFSNIYATREAIALLIMLTL